MTHLQFVIASYATAAIGLAGFLISLLCRPAPAAISFAATGKSREST